ncbi:hypothetical protein ASD02_17210 [Ensifer sp. Root1252]|nr:hypothetical protein ASD00_19895 [Ensifer sp. Root31]KQW34943.1 hypothetical protein ASD02_17210 [Ensifer sp. Root1252]KRC57267.1 hypothetical protein ASE32_20525 [Ensifer sp. Root231]KRC87762.1 hypothetical protein ASE47_14680 [Ensifer sp. Root258]
MRASFARAGANLAMLVHLNMLRAFRGAGPTRISTGRNKIVGDIHVGAGPARGNRPGRHADVGAIEIEPNALNEFTDVRLAKAGVCATRANLSTAVAMLYAAHQRVCRTPVYIRMAIHHFTYKHRFPRSFSGVSLQQWRWRNVPSTERFS